MNVRLGESGRTITGTLCLPENAPLLEGREGYVPIAVTREVPASSNTEQGCGPSVVQY
jgi:hypothetical protein